MSYEGPEIQRRQRLDKSPKHKEKKMRCHTCGYRTTHLYDHGLDRHICSECELK